MLKLGGELAQHLSSTVAPLTIHDLPAVLWWPDDAPFGSPVFADLAAECDRVLVDSGGFRGDGSTRLLGMSDAVDRGLWSTTSRGCGWSSWRELSRACSTTRSSSPSCAD